MEETIKDLDVNPKTPIPVSLHDVELSDRDVEVILDAAKIPSAVVARLRGDDPTKEAISNGDPSEAKSEIIAGLSAFLDAIKSGKPIEKCFRVRIVNLAAMPSLPEPSIQDVVKDMVEIINDRSASF
jgi:hypothetical protein